MDQQRCMRRTWMLPCLVRHALSSTPLSSAGSTSFTPWPVEASKAQ